MFFIRFNFLAKLWRVSLVTLLIIFSAACATLDADTADFTACGHPPQKILHAVVPVKSGATGNASGVVIAKNRVLTVAHAVNPRENLFVVINGDKRPALVEHLNIENDLALLSVDTSGALPVPLSTDTPIIQEMTWAVGYPLAGEQKISVGYYQQPYNGRLYTTNHVNSGVSGGALLRCQAGEYSLTGVVHGYVALMADDDSIVNLGDSTSVRPDVIAEFILTAQSLGVAMVSPLPR